jgi:hypothetical protein
MLMESGERSAEVRVRGEKGRKGECLWGNKPGQAGLLAGGWEKRDACLQTNAAFSIRVLSI